MTSAETEILRECVKNAEDAAYRRGKREASESFIDSSVELLYWRLCMSQRWEDKELAAVIRRREHVKMAIRHISIIEGESAREESGQ